MLRLTGDIRNKQRGEGISGAKLLAFQIKHSKDPISLHICFTPELVFRVCLHKACLPACFHETRSSPSRDWLDGADIQQSRLYRYFTVRYLCTGLLVTNIETVFPDLGTKLLRDRITNIHLTFTYTTIFGPHSHMPTHTTTTTPTRAAAGLQARSKRTDGRLLSLLLCRRKSKSGWTWNRRGPLLLLLLMHRNVKTHVGGRGKENA